MLKRVRFRVQVAGEESSLDADVPETLCRDSKDDH